MTMGAQAREKAREARKAREAAERQRRQRARAMRIGGLIIGALVVAIVVSVVIATGKGNDPVASDKPLVTPATATANGAFVVGQATAPVKLEVYLDYMCPYCGRFERANGGEIDKLIADGTVRLEVHPLAFLDRFSNGKKYSTRSANAFVTVAEKAPDQLLAFNAALYNNQPHEGTDGLKDEDIARLATQVGVPQAVADSFAALTYEPWLAQSTQAAFDSGISGTPTVKIDGQKFEGDLYTAGPLTEAILAAKAQ
jgi:protein-disulfide isomerase